MKNITLNKIALSIAIVFILINSFITVNAVKELKNNTFNPIRYMRDYQIECTTDSMFIMDNSRVVGVIPYDASMISGIILQDNE